MTKKYTSLGLMSGTSGDGVDASIIESDGNSQYKTIEDKFFQYDNEIYDSIHTLKDKIQNHKDLHNYNKECSELEKKITLFHAKTIKELEKNNLIQIVGFHGQTIFHDSEKRITKQLGNGNLLFQLIKKNVIYDFRQNDIINGGEGAPLTPIFHQLLANKLNLDFPVCILNIGGISNVTIIDDKLNPLKIFSKDIGPGNCLIDSWVRKNSKFKFDTGGNLAAGGNVNLLSVEQAQDLFLNINTKKKYSLDTNDFDISFARGLSLEDGAATVTDLTAKIIGNSLTEIISKYDDKKFKVLICGGGRKNSFLINNIKKNIPKNIHLELLDQKGIDGDFIEPQAFAYLAIRSYLELPISFPNTTGCKKPSKGGKIVKN